MSKKGFFAVLLAVSVCATVKAERPPAGIDFGTAHITLGMEQSQALKLIQADGFFKIVLMKGDTDGRNFEVDRADGTSIGALGFDAHHRLDRAFRSWDSPDAFYDGMVVITRLLKHLKDEGLVRCTVAPLIKTNSPDMINGDDILIDCGQKLVKISAFTLGGAEQNTKVVDITEQLVSSR